MKYVLQYEPADFFIERVMPHFAAHRARWKEFMDAGTLIMIGPFSDPEHGAMGIFRTRQAAEDFAKGDPFVTYGIVKSWNIREWREAIVD
jgi:uncharacterized protein YciI